MSKAQATGEGVAIFALIAVVSTRGLMLRSGRESTEGPIVHRECTGNAETTFGHFDAIEVQSPMGTAALRAGRAELQELPERKLRGIERELRLDANLSGVQLMTKDPVCGMKVDENNSQYQTQYGGKKYNFCSQECKTKFEQKPEQYTESASAA